MGTYRRYKLLTTVETPSKDQTDLVNAQVWIPESRTENGIAEVPLTEHALQAFRDQIWWRILGRGCFRAAPIQRHTRKHLRRRGM